MKRKRVQDEDPPPDDISQDPEEDDDLEEEDVRPRRIKRRKVVDEDFIADEEIEEEGEDDDLLIDDEPEKQQPATPGSSTGDESEDFIEDDDNEEELTNDPDAGIIERVILENFMCHVNLNVELKSHINIITGSNGSGKSAIMTAVQVCFGSRKIRGTSSNLVQFIREGADYTMISVILRNRGVDGYRRDKFGKRITIERTITRNGSKSYKLISETGEVIARTKAELERVLQHFNIHVTNPSIMMSQDESKKFLANSRAKDKYKLFLEASQLQSMLSNFDEIKKNKEQMQKILVIKLERLQEDKAELEKLDSLMRVTSEITTLEKQKDTLRGELAWRYVVDIEDQVQRIQRKYDEEKEKLEKASDKFDEIKKDLGEKEKEDKRISEMIGTKIVAKRNARERHREVTREYKEVLREKANIDGKIEDHQRNIRNGQKKIKKLKRKIEEVKSREEVDNTDRKSQLQREVDDNIRLNEEDREKYDSAKRALYDTKMEVRKIADEVNDKMNETRIIIGKVRKLRDMISRLKRQKQNKMSFFRADFIKLLSHIQSNHRKFSSPPIGPVAMYLDVREKEWATSCEVALRRQMNVFIVNNGKDRQLLNKIIDRNRLYEPGIYVYKFVENEKKYSKDLMRSKGGVPTDPNLTTVYDMLKLDTSLAKKKKFRFDEKYLEATIFNCLVDNAQIERAVLAEDRDEAIQQFFGDPRKWPRNVFKIFTKKHGDWLQLNKGNEITQTEQHQNQFWGASDYEAQITRIKGDIKRIQEEQEDPIQDEVREMKKQKSVAEKEVRKAERKLKEVKDRVKRRRLKIKKLERDLEEALAEEDEIDDKETEINEYESSIDETENHIAKHTIMINTLKEELKEFPPREKIHKDKVRNIQNEMDTVDTEVAELRISAEKINKELYELKTKLKFEERDKNKYTQIVRVLEEKLKGKTLELQDLIASANLVTSNVRLTNVRTITQIEDDTETLDKKIRLKNEELHGRTVAEIKTEYVERKKNYLATSEALKTAENNLHMIRESLHKRFKKWKKIRKMYGNMCGIGFNRAMSQKGHTGTLKFDHENELLDMEVQLSTSESKVRETKQLSGGERSFSTIALICALWQVCESPFRMLDEVDIFMDSVYRHKALQLLLELANLESNINKQLILITPQTTRGIKRGKNVNIIFMRDPERNGLTQTTMEDFFPQ